MKKPEITHELLLSDKYFLIPYSDNEILIAFKNTNDILLKQKLKLELIRRKEFTGEFTTKHRSWNIFK